MHAHIQNEQVFLAHIHRSVSCCAADTILVCRPGITNALLEGGRDGGREGGKEGGKEGEGGGGGGKNGRNKSSRQTCCNR